MPGSISPNWLLALQTWRWLDGETAAGLFRDHVDFKGEESGMLDFWDSDPVRVFLAYMREGLNEGIIRAKGVPQNGLGRRRLPTPVRNTSSEDAQHRAIIAADDRKYEDLRFKRWSVVNYANQLKDKELRRRTAVLRAKQDAQQVDLPDQRAAER